MDLQENGFSLFLTLSISSRLEVRSQKMIEVIKIYKTMHRTDQTFVQCP